MSGLRARGWEYVAALAACTAFSWWVSRRLLEPAVFSDDALVHQFWMWQWRDPALFTDGLTELLRGSTRYPDGYEALFRLGTHLAGPIVLGEWLGVALMAVSGWLIFLIVREHTDWRPAASIAAALFLLLVDIHRFHGGFPRAFVHPVVLGTVLLALRRHDLAAALAAAAGALLYPPAALLAGGTLLLSAVRFPLRDVDRRRAACGLLALTAAAVLLGGEAPEVLSAAEARAFPEFGRDGPLHFFVPSPVEYLRQNRSGFDLRATGPILALAALALLLARRENRRLLRPEVYALPGVALAAAQAVLFELYLPHRYTYPLVAFFAIAAGVTLRPTWEVVTRRWEAFGLLAGAPAVAGVALYLFPLGPRAPVSAAAPIAGAIAVAAAAALAPRLSRAPALGAAVTRLAPVALLAASTERWERGSPCAVTPGTRYLASSGSRPDTARRAATCAGRRCSRSEGPAGAAGGPRSCRTAASSATCCRRACRRCSGCHPHAGPGVTAPTRCTRSRASVVGMREARADGERPARRWRATGQRPGRGLPLRLGARVRDRADHGRDRADLGLPGGQLPRRRAPDLGRHPPRGPRRRDAGGG